MRMILPALRRRGGAGFGRCTRRDRSEAAPVASSFPSRTPARPVDFLGPRGPLGGVPSVPPCPASGCYLLPASARPARLRPGGSLARGYQVLFLLSLLRLR